MKLQRITSIGQDIIFASTLGQKKKTSSVGITDNRKVLELLNKMGHCASYHTVQELETELTFNANKSIRSTLFGMTLNLE